jgi:RNA-binding protein PNO1
MDVINNDEFTVGSSNTSKGKKLAIKKKLSSHSKASLASAKSKTSGSGTFLSTQPAPMAIDKSYLGDEDNDEQFERYPLDYSGRGIPVADNTTGIKRRVAAVLAAAASSSMDIDSPFSDEEDDSAILIDPSSITSSNRPTPVTRLPAAQVQAMSTLLSFPAVSHTSTSGLTQRRKVSIPPHRMTPLKRDWVKIYGPLVEELGLQVRMNLGRKWVELKVS